MSLLSECSIAGGLSDRLRDSYAMSAELISDIIHSTCRRFRSHGETVRTARIERLIEAGAWTDVALALIDLELPQWQIRRIAYDEGEWHCALSRQRELPDWLDQSIEAHHADLALAIMDAFIEARHSSAPSTRTSVPAVSRDADPRYQPLCSDNFA